jgi:superfamily II DNA/RNA helicase
VGRTARAGCGGRAITLVSDARRKMMKEVLRLKGEVTAEGQGQGEAASVSGQVLSRTIPGAVLAQYTEKIRALEPELRDHFRREREKASLDALQMEAEKAENLLLHEQEISARPVRTWYQTERQKGELREASREQVKEEQTVAQVGKAEAQVKKSAAERARELALTDDYPLDREKDRSHKLSRKKRRRLEALKAEAEDGADSGEESRRKAVAGALEAAPKRAKLSVRDKENAKRDRVLSEVGMKKVAVAREPTGDGEGDDAQAAAVANKKRGAKTTTMKVVRQSFAVGGLDQDYVDWGMGGSGSAGSHGGSKGGMTKSQIRQAAREKPFTEFDATKKLRKGGKVANKAFKSKSKFKRR